MNINDEQLCMIREFPIEDLIQKARDRFYSHLPGEPSEKTLLNLRSLLVASEKALEIILAVDSKVRPQKEWLHAVNQVEFIRDEALEMIEILRNIV